LVPTFTVSLTARAAPFRASLTPLPTRRLESSGTTRPSSTTSRTPRSTSPEPRWPSPDSRSLKIGLVSLFLILSFFVFRFSFFHFVFLTHFLLYSLNFRCHCLPQGVYPVIGAWILVVPAVFLNTLVHLFLSRISRKNKQLTQKTTSPSYL